MTLYLSLLVHESLHSIESQLDNIQRAMPGSMTVLHVSPLGDIDVDALDRIVRARWHSAIVNSRQVPSQWGNLVDAHLANWDLVASRGDATHFAFGASNEMFIRAGAESYVQSRDNGFSLWPIGSGTSWDHAELAMSDTALLDVTGEAVYFSQVEGSFYEAVVMADIADLWRRVHRGESRYPREETVFPSVAASIGVVPRGTPYVFSEVTRRTWWIERLTRAVRAASLGGLSHQSSVRLARRLEARRLRGRLNTRDLDSLLLGVLPRCGEAIPATDGSPPTSIYESSHIYGVKRVPREADAPLRRAVDAKFSIGGDR